MSYLKHVTGKKKKNGNIIIFWGRKWMTVISLISPRGGTKRERRRMATATATTRVSAFLSLPSTPPQKSQLPLNKQLSYINKPKSLSISHARTCSGKFIHFLRLASNSSTSTVEEEEKEEEEQEQEIQSSSPDLSSVRCFIA